MFHADEIITSCSCCSSIAFDKRVNPIQAPKSVCRDQGRVIVKGPILVYEGEKSVHEVRDFPEVRRKVVTNVNWFLAVSPAELSNVRDRYVIQGPQGVFVERLDTFLKSNFNAICQQVVLSQKVLFLNPRVEFRIVFLSNGHGGWA